MQRLDKPLGQDKFDPNYTMEKEKVKEIMNNRKK
jgi:hypothetical protein